MPLGAVGLADLLKIGCEDADKGLKIVPFVSHESIRTGGEASVQLHLGRWFAAQRLTRNTHLDIYSSGQPDARDVDEKSHFVPFGTDFVLHPGRFVLGVTLEWIALPHTHCGSVLGKSYIGRRGLVIETAAGIQPSFSGCLTLELANVGEIPLRLRPGMPVAQLFVDELVGAGDPDTTERAPSFDGKRRPSAGKLKSEKALESLAKR